MTISDERFELKMRGLEDLGFADEAEQLRERDTAQREALARVEADNSQLQLIVNSHANMRDTAQAQLAEAVGLIEKSADLAGELGDYLVSLAKRHSGTELLDQERNLRAFLARHAQSEQQGYQGAQAVDDYKAWYEEAIVASNELGFAGMSAADVIKYQGEELAEARAALATQPAAGEPEQQTAINADDLPTKKYPLGAFDFDSPSSAPVAASEPIQVEAVAITREDEDGLYLDWVLEGGISALEAPGVVLLVAHGKVTDDQGGGEIYLAPPAAAHGDGLHFNTAEDLASAIRQVSAYEDLGPELIAEEMFKQAGASSAHGDELVAVVGTVPDGSGFKSLDFKVELESLPDGTRLYASAHGGEAEPSVDFAAWLIDHREGQAVTEEDMHEWLGEWYEQRLAMRAQAGEGESS